MSKLWLMGRVAVALSVMGGAIALHALPVAAQEQKDDAFSGLRNALNAEQNPQAPNSPQVSESLSSNTAVAQLSDLSHPATTMADWVAQINVSLTQITEVWLNPTDSGLEVVLATLDGTQPPFTTSVVGNALIITIPNAALALPGGEAFQSVNPVERVAFLEVTSFGATDVRVAITGTDAPPIADVRSVVEGLFLSVTPGIASTEDAGDDAIQIVVTEEQENYYTPSASVGTRTETPLRDIPQSIQVIPQQVIEDQRATRLIEVLQNAPGVVQGGVSPRTYSNIFNIRGFDASDSILINGLPDPTNQNVGFGANIERVEVLRGPASVLFGQGGLGGRINLVTEQPLSEPFYSIEASAGNYEFYRGAIDLSGPLNDNRTVLYRLNASAQTTESFIDFYEQQRYLIAPVLSWQIGDRTSLTLEADFSAVEGPFDLGIPAVGSVLPNPNGDIPRDRYIGEPNVDNSQQRVFRFGFDLNHDLSEDWQLRSVFRTSLLRLNREIVFSRGAGALQEDGRTLNRIFDDQDYNEDIYNLDTYVAGNFTTGSIQHQVVAGVNLFRYDTNTDGFTRSVDPLDIFNPDYGATPTGPEEPAYDITNRTQQLGFYFQDLISLTDNFKVLLGGRFDIASQDFQDTVADVEDFSQEEAFSPRVGIVYQPFEPLSLYASYSRSFNQATSTFSPAESEPERGEQFEIGAKLDLNDQLAATLAFYDLTRSNLPTTDPNNPLLTIQVGEQRSRGIEFDIGGEVLPGWNIIAGYAYTDAEITEDNDFESGNRLNNVPEHAFNIWTTYEIQSGDLQGLGFGLGVFYFGERQGDLANTFELPSYARTDATIFYSQDNFRIAFNVRNLFDVDYFVSAQNRSRVFPGDPLTVIGTISWEF